jgi:glycosyltransferase involved in cell wall biosynthesis
VPYVVRPLGTIDPWSLRQKRLKKQLLLALGGQRLLDGAAAIQYTSAEEKRLAEDALQLTRGIVIPLGIEPQFLNDAPVTGAARPDGPYVLALSRLHPVKNLEALITAFGAITATGRIDRNWRLVIAGNGEPAYAASLKQLAEREGVAPRVTFTGWIDGDAKHRLIAQASVYTLPSFHENFGVSLVEALAAGVPALVSREVHLAEAIRGAGAGWVVDTDEASVRAGLIEALRDASERELRGQAARGLARTFAWPGIGAQLNRLYQKLASGSSPAAGAVPVEAA